MKATADGEIVALVLRPTFDNSSQSASEQKSVGRWITRGQMYLQVLEWPRDIFKRDVYHGRGDAIFWFTHQEMVRSNSSIEYSAGALGYAMIGKIGDPDQAFALYEQELRQRKGNLIEAIANILGVSTDLVMRLYEANREHGIPPSIIADWLSHN